MCVYVDWLIEAVQGERCRYEWGAGEEVRGGVGSGEWGVGEEV